MTRSLGAVVGVHIKGLYLPVSKANNGVLGVGRPGSIAYSCLQAVKCHPGGQNICPMT